MVPNTVSVMSALPTNADRGLNTARVGAGCPTVNEAACPVPPPGEGLYTLTLAVAADARRLESMVAVSVVVDTYWAGRIQLFHFTWDCGVKFDPVTVTPIVALPGAAESGLSAEIPGIGYATYRGYGP